MLNMIHPHTTRRIGKSQGFHGLAVADANYADGTPVMVTWWRLTPSELKTLNEGGLLEIAILGNTHPPIRPSIVAGENPDVPKQETLL
jgi:hypothetical protein